MKTSSLYGLNWQDALKGFIVAVITAGLATVEQSISAGIMPNLIQLKTAGLVGLGAGLAYLIKNFFTSPSIVTPIAPSTPVSPTDTSAKP